LNDKVYIEAAAGLAKLSLDNFTQIEDSIRYAFQRVTCRKATAEEFDALKELARVQKAEFDKDPESARLLLEHGRWSIEESENQNVAATLMIIANVLLNLDEILVRG
ncbi:MAG: hypothetical protein AAEJ04_04840, partial [Planctomycetota bacterium]